MTIANHSEIRNEFPVTRKFTFLDVANKCAPPIRVAQALCDFIRDASETSGDKDLWAHRVNVVKALFAKLSGAAPGEIALVKNTSEAFNLVANSIHWQRGDNLVINDMEHPNNVFPWLRLREAGVEIRVVPSLGGIVTPEQMSRYVDDRTRLLSMASTECVTGTRMDLPAIADLCHKHGAFFLVDGVQSLGILRMDVKASRVDMLAAGAYKGMLSPHGLAFLYLNSATTSHFTPPVASRASMTVDPKLHKVTQYEVNFRHDAGRYEIGNYAYGPVTAGCVALDYLLQLGIENIESHVLHLTGLLTRGLAERGFTTAGPVSDQYRSSIVSVLTPEAPRIVDELSRKNIITTLREGCVRMSLHVYNNEEDVHTVLEALNASRSMSHTSDTQPL